MFSLAEVRGDVRLDGMVTTMGAVCDDTVRSPTTAIVFGTTPYGIAIGGELVVVAFAAGQSLLAAAEAAGMKLPANCLRAGSAQRALSDSTSGPSHLA
jgi:hypothetical protein